MAALAKAAQTGLQYSRRSLHQTVLKPSLKTHNLRSTSFPPKKHSTQAPKPSPLLFSAFVGGGSDILQ